MYAADKPSLKETYLGHIASIGKHDLIFFEKRSTPKVVPTGQSFTAPETYGKQTKRRPATEEEEKIISRGDWVRVDQSGKKGGEDGYKKTRTKGREHLVHDADVTAYLEHVGVKGMRWGVRKQPKRDSDGPPKHQALKFAAGTTAVVAGSLAVGYLLSRNGRSSVASLVRGSGRMPSSVANPVSRLQRDAGRMFSNSQIRSDAFLSRPAGSRVFAMPGATPRMPSAAAMQTRVRDISQTEWRSRVSSLSKNIAEANREQDAWMRSLGLGGARLRG